MEKVTPAVQKFFENFKATHYVQRVIKSVALISHIEEIGGIRFYLYPPSHGENHAILSLYKNEKSRDWELALLHDGKIAHGKSRDMLPANMALKLVWEYIQTGVFRENDEWD